jgi:diguanylate cyclase (GGDEF)-like protein
MYDADQNVISGLGIVEDITQQIKYEEQLKYQAYYDSLTGLFNRDSLTQYIKQFIHKLHRSREYGVLLFIDIDNFKNINDSLGHNVGDLILKTFSQRVKNALRKEDIFARLGGDEFVILISQTDKDISKIETAALNISAKIHDAVKEAIQIETNTLYITLSLGVKILQPDENNIHTILKHADIAMYQSKNSGKDQTSFYDTNISKKMHEQLILYNELKIAIEKKQFELYLQPIVDLKTERIVSAEALIRWNHPTKGLVFPNDFIDYAEANNLIVDIGNWVIERAFEIYKEFQNSLEDIAINISLKQFYEDDFVDILLKNANKYHLDPHSIKLELTESVTLKNLDETISKMLTLKAHGFKFSMDDFGTGYSSLSYLKNLPFDYLKIDQSFVLQMMQNESDKTLVKIIIDVAKQFNFLVIAEGVETAKHVAFMKENGCDYYQGYFASKPIRLNEFHKLL